MEASASTGAETEADTTKDPDNQDLIKQLYEQIGQLSVERDWLKKKSALFGLGN